MEIDFRRHYCPSQIPCLLRQCLERLEAESGSGVAEMAERLGVSRAYLYMLESRKYEGRYPIQVMLERFLLPGGEELVNASLRHDPSLGAKLVSKGRDVCGTQQALADRLGVSRDYLRRVQRGERDMSFGMQVALEVLAGQLPA